MHAPPARPPDPVLPLSPPAAWYSVLGVQVAVVSDVAEALLHVDETYVAFRAAPAALDQAAVLQLERAPEGIGYIVSGAAAVRRWLDYEDALLDLLDRIVHTLLARLLARGIYAFHAGAVVHSGVALALVGRSGQGKTTLTLGLLRRGMGLLSDELTVVEPSARRIVPYHRSLHLRPGTLDLIPELRFLRQRPRHQLGGGSEWAVAPHDLARAFPGCLAEAAPLRAVLLLDGMPHADAQPAITPVPAALAAIEVLRGAWAAAVDFDGTLAHIGQLLDSASCARIRVGALEPTLDAIVAWLEAGRG